MLAKTGGVMMTEAEWHRSRDPEAMLKVLRGCAVASEHKLRLYACTCATKAITQHPNAADYQRILVTAERLTEGSVPLDEIRVAEEEAHAIEIASSRIDARLAGAAGCTLEREAYRGACGVVTDLLRYERESHGDTNPEPYADLIRCIFGNPYRGFNVGFRPVVIDPEWRTSTVVSLAQSMYESRDFSTMPILSDALQDAGCENEDILNHCRSAGPHVRGCWVIDLVLGKS